MVMETGAILETVKVATRRETGGTGTYADELIHGTGEQEEEEGGEDEFENGLNHVY